MNSEMPWTKPQDGEVFESLEHCLKRLNIWAFLEGGCFVTGRLRKDKGTYEYPCAYYGEPRNKRDLEDRVVKEEDKIVSQRKRDTIHYRYGCEVLYYLSYRPQQFRRKGPKVFIGTWRKSKDKTSITHTGHPVPLNLLGIHYQLKTTDAYLQSTSQAFKYRTACQPYSEALKLLKQDGLGIQLKRKQYYNLIRHAPFNKEDPLAIYYLLQALEDKGFRYRTYIKD